MIIAISGMDCCGKSTQIALLAAALERSAPVAIFWHRPGYSKELDALRRIARRASPGALPTPGESVRRDKAFGKGWVRRLWLAVALVDMGLQYGVKVRLKSLFGTCVICDRYLEDGLIDLSLRFPEMILTDGCPAKLLRAICPKPDHALLLLLSAEQQAHRMGMKKEPFPDSEAVRVRRLECYQMLGKSGRVEVVDAARPVEEVFAQISERLGLIGLPEAGASAHR